MRANLDFALAHRLRHNNPTFTTVTMRLTGSHVIGVESPSMLFLDPGGSSRDVYLPAITPSGGQVVTIFNTGVETLTVRSAGGTFIAALNTTEAAEFTSTTTDWYFRRNSTGTISYRIVDTSPTTILDSDSLVIVSRSGNGAFTINLCTLAAAAERPKYIAVWDDYTGDLTINAAGSETIYGSSSWTSVPLGPSHGGGILSFLPIAALNGWIVES